MNLISAKVAILHAKRILAGRARRHDPKTVFSPHQLGFDTAQKTRNKELENGSLQQIEIEDAIPVDLNRT
jgi:hypothetical protein